MAGLAVLAATWLGGCATPVAGPLLGSDPKSACEALKAAVISANRIVWPGQTSGAATVDSAVLEAPAALAFDERALFPAAAVAPAVPAYCKVLGRIAAVGEAPTRFGSR